MSKYYISLGAILFILLFYFGKVAFVKEEKTTTLKNDSVEAVIKSFWESSLEVDADNIGKIVITDGEDIVKEKEKEEMSPQKESRVEVYERTKYPESQEVKKINAFTDKLIENGTPGTVRVTASYIIATNIGVDRYIIEKKEINNNKARVTVKIANYKGDFDDSSNKIIFHLMKNENEWKIVTVQNYVKEDA